MSIKNDLASIVGPDSVLDDEQSLSRYASDQSFVSSRMPDLVAFAHSVEQVQSIVKYANKTRVPLVPFSSGLNLQGGTVPREGGIVLNLSRMNKILAVDVDNWSCVIEPGVTASALQDELERHGLRAMLPLGIHPNRSALTSFLERDPALAAASFEYGNELIMDTEIVLPSGDLFRTGLWSSGVKPGSPMGPVRAMLNRLWTGAQGTLGIMTKMNIKVEYLPRSRNLFMIPFDSFPEAMEPLRMLQRKEIGLECFMLNAFNAAALLCSDWAVPQDFPAPMTPSRSLSLCGQACRRGCLPCASAAVRACPRGKSPMRQRRLSPSAPRPIFPCMKTAACATVCLPSFSGPGASLKNSATAAPFTIFHLKQPCAASRIFKKRLWNLSIPIIIRFRMWASTYCPLSAAGPITARLIFTAIPGTAVKPSG